MQSNSRPHFHFAWKAEAGREILTGMSRDNVELVREQFEATNRKDFVRPMADWADDVELVAIVGPLAGTHSGRDAVAAFFGDWFRSYDVHFDLRKIRDGGDAVAVAAHHQARGRNSGVELEGDFFSEYRVRDGKIVRIEFHANWSQALEAVGLGD
jgi:ketosteroid isomerase-like protein